MWTATLQQIEKDERPRAVILFTDNTKYKLLETFSLDGHTAESFRNTVESRRKALETSYAFIDTIDTNFDLTPTPKHEPTADELAQREYLAQRLALAQLKTDLDLKLITQEEYDAKLAEVTAIKPAVK